MLFPWYAHIPTLQEIPRHGQFPGTRAFLCAREHSTEATWQYYNKRLYYIWTYKRVNLIKRVTAFFPPKFLYQDKYNNIVVLCFSLGEYRLNH